MEQEIRVVQGLYGYELVAGKVAMVFANLGYGKLDGLNLTNVASAKLVISKIVFNGSIWVAQQLTSINGNLGAVQFDWEGTQKSFGWRMRNDPAVYGDSVSFELPSVWTMYNGVGTYLLRLELFNSRGIKIRSHQVAQVFCAPAEFKVLFVPLLDWDGTEYDFAQLLNEIEETLERFPVPFSIEQTLGINWDLAEPATLIEDWFDSTGCVFDDHRPDVLTLVGNARSAYNQDEDLNRGIPAEYAQGVFSQGINEACTILGWKSFHLGASRMAHSTMTHELDHQLGYLPEDLDISDTCEGDLNQNGECDDWAWVHTMFIGTSPSPLQHVICPVTGNAQNTSSTGRCDFLKRSTYNQWRNDLGGECPQKQCPLFVCGPYQVPDYENCVCKSIFDP